MMEPNKSHKIIRNITCVLLQTRGAQFREEKVQWHINFQTVMICCSMHVVRSEMGGNNFHFHPKTREMKPALVGGTEDLAELTEGLSEAVGRKLWFHCFVGKELRCHCGIFLQ